MSLSEIRIKKTKKKFSFGKLIGNFKEKLQRKEPVISNSMNINVVEKMK